MIFCPTSLFRKPERIKAQQRPERLYTNMDPGLKSSLWTSTSSFAPLPPLRRWAANEFPVALLQLGNLSFHKLCTKPTLTSVENVGNIGRYFMYRLISTRYIPSIIVQQKFRNFFAIIDEILSIYRYFTDFSRYFPIYRYCSCSRHCS